MIKNTEFVSSITVEMMYLLALAYIWHTWVAVRERTTAKAAKKAPSSILSRPRAGVDTEGLRQQSFAWLNFCHSAASKKPVWVYYNPPRRQCFGVSNAFKLVDL